MKIGDKVVVNSKFAGCFNGKTGVVVGERMDSLTTATRLEVKFDIPVDIGFCVVEKWDFPAALLRRECV